MTCALVRESLSAGLDGEVAPLAPEVVDRHLAACAACRSFATSAAALHRQTRVSVAEAVPDLSAAIMAAAGQHAVAARRRDRADLAHLARLGLVTVGITQLVAALQALVTGDGGAPVHLVRELGSLDVALAVVFLLVAARPSRAVGVLPMVAVLVGCLTGATVVDVVAGDVSASNEVVHLPDVAGLFLSWVLAGSPLPVRAGGRRRPVGGVAAP